MTISHVRCVGLAWGYTQSNIPGSGRAPSRRPVPHPLRSPPPRPSVDLDGAGCCRPPRARLATLSQDTAHVSCLMSACVSSFYLSQSSDNALLIPRAEVLYAPTRSNDRGHADTPWDTRQSRPRPATTLTDRVTALSLNETRLYSSSASRKPYKYVRRILTAPLASGVAASSATPLGRVLHTPVSVHVWEASDT